MAEYLELGGVTLRAAIRRSRMDAIFDRFPIVASRWRQQSSTLSGGEQKMLEIVRTLLLEPRLLLVDEPSIGLAPRLAREVTTIRRPADGGVTILLLEQNV